MPTVSTAPTTSPSDAATGLISKAFQALGSDTAAASLISALALGGAVFVLKILATVPPQSFTLPF